MNHSLSIALPHRADVWAVGEAYESYVGRWSRLVARDFRNLHRVELELPPDGIVVIGENGQGKSNLLEAIYYFHLLRSVRGGRDVDLVRFDAPAFHLTAHVHGTRAHVATAAFE